MDLHNSRAFTRRRFLHNGLTLASAAVTIPYFLQRSATVLAQSQNGQTSLPGVPQDHILVVVQLAGGNDGLNTVVPFGDALYYRARPGIGIPEREVLKLKEGLGIGLHPRMTGLKELYDEGMLTVVQGVGYPNPNRSHFKSMDIWHTADTDGIGDGWLGRYFDNQCAGSPDGCSGHAGIAIGRTAPLAMEGRRFKPISFESEELFRWTGLDLHESMEKPYRKIISESPEEALDPNSAESFLVRTALDAQVASDQIRRAVGQRPLVQYPPNQLARQLQMVAAMIRAELATRVYYVSLGGFDTHAGQGGANGSHANLLDQFASSLRAFYSDLKAQGNDGRVLTLSFSEFGRRVGQNASNGTDHGTAAPMFLCGPMVRAGVHGAHPSLSDLDDGDLKFHTDFRSVYTAVLEGWMKADAEAVLGRKFKAVEVLKKA